MDCPFFIILYKIYILINQGFAFGVNITAIIYPKNIAEAIPPAQAVAPPVNTPKNPSLGIAVFTPLANKYPNPIIGTVAPHPPKSTIRS